MSKHGTVSLLSTYATTLLLFISLINSCCAETRELYLVLLDGDPPVAFHDEYAHMNSEIIKVHEKKLVDSHDQILQSRLEAGSYNKLYSFKHVVNGFAVHTTPSQAEELKNTPEVKLVEKDRGVKKMTTYTPEFLGLQNGVWNGPHMENRHGEGIVIGFVDTGINPFHPSFVYDPVKDNNSSTTNPHFSGACETGPMFPPSACNGKIISARFFAEGALSAGGLNSSVNFLSPFDADGHGSHVAAIAAGNSGVPVVVNGYLYGQASGMAPNARIAVYKALFPTRGTLTDVLAAIDQATQDGVDVLTIAVEPDDPPRDTITFLCAFDLFLLFARRAGVLVVQAAGNSGPSASTVIGYSPWAMAAAAGSTDRAYNSSLNLGNGQKVGGVGLSGPSRFLSKLVLARDGLKPDGRFPRTPDYIEECQHPEAFDPNIVTDSILICTFSSGFYNGTSTVTAIVNTAKTLHLSGFVLIANSNYGDYIAEPIPLSLPGILIPKVSDTRVILQYYEQQIRRDSRGFVTYFGATAAIGEGREAIFQGRAPIVSRFSSRGPDFIDVNKTPTDVLKPDILAPGYQIWAVWSPISAKEPLLSGINFALLSGTSMAAPHIAGIAALIKQYNPTWTPAMIASAITTTATKRDNYGDLIMAEAADRSLHIGTYFDFGAGHVSASRAIDPGLVLPIEFDDYINFLCSLPNMDPNTVREKTGAWCNQPLSHPADLNLPSVTISRLEGSLTLRRSFRNVVNKSEAYLASVLPPKGTAVGLNPNSFTIAPEGTQELNIQFNVTKALRRFHFGQIVLTGSLNHIIRIPLSVRTVLCKGK